MTRTRIDAALLDRAAGVLTGAAVAQVLAVGEQRSAGNAALIGTGPVALAHLGDPAGCAQAGIALAQAHADDPQSAQACVLWALTIRHCVLTGELDARVGLRGLDAAAATTWSTRLSEAEVHRPGDFTNLDGVVPAVQAAWSAILNTPVLPYDPERHFEDALRAAVSAGGRAHTGSFVADGGVAVMAGALLGACHGAGAVPPEWSALLPAREVAVLAAQARTLATASWAPDPDAELFEFPED
ncbi:MAG: ADP-ribosylglycohydrolase family protein [Sporichthyaceae bacterium]